MSTVGQRIRSARERMGMSQRRLAEQAGLSPQFVSDIERGRTPPSLKTLKLIAAALEISPTLLLEDSEVRPALEVVELPILGRVPAGGPVLSEEHIRGHMAMPRRLVKEPAFILEVTGNSMQDMGIDDGDYLLVRVQPQAENGQVVIARIDGEVTCKRFYLTGSYVTLEPANQTLRPMRIPAEKVEIIGIVTRVIKKVGD